MGQVVMVARKNWRVDTWEHKGAPRVRREFVLEADARAWWNAFKVRCDWCTTDAEAIGRTGMLLRSGYADRSTRDAGAGVWNIIEEK